MDNALKFEKVAGLPHDNYNRVPDDLVTSSTTSRPTAARRIRSSRS